MYFTFNNIKLFSILSVVPKEKFQINKKEETDHLKRIKKVIGVKKSYKVNAKDNISDLFFFSAQRILKENKLNKDNIKIIICVTQTPDYTMPSTSNMLHEKLGLNKDCLAFDLNQGCSGYIYGLLAINSILSNIKNGFGILLSGDLMSKTIPGKDIGNKLLFGDGVSASLIQNKKNNFSFFKLGSAGFGSEMLTLRESGISTSSKKTNFFMDGKEVFSFALKSIPILISDLKKKYKIKDKDISHYIFHQANKMMLDKIFQILKVPVKKRLFSIANYGNTSSASIPITLCKSKHKKMKKCIISGFGAGFSFGAAYLDLSKTKISKIYKYE